MSRRTRGVLRKNIFSYRRRRNPDKTEVGGVGVKRRNAPQAMAHFRDHGRREGRLFGCDGAGEDTNLDTVFDGKLMIMHMPKSGGTTFRSVVFRRARSMKKSLQTYYGHDSIGFDRFDRKHPADVVMGHSVTLNTLQPVPSGLRVRYTTMLRSPYAWYVSLSRAGANFFGRRGFGWAERHSRRYLHIHDHTMKEPVGRPYDPGFLERAIETCPGLLRDSNDTQCHGHLSQWHGGGVQLPPSGTSEKCTAYEALFTSPQVLPLLNERYEDSIWLLFQYLGWGKQPRSPHENKRREVVYRKKISLRVAVDISEGIRTTCMPDIYDAARKKFERLHGEARAFKEQNPQGDLATSLAAQRWPPLVG